MMLLTRILLQVLIIVIAVFTFLLGWKYELAESPTVSAMIILMSFIVYI